MTRFGGVSGDILRQYIERIERLEEEKRGIMDDIKDVFAEAKSNGFDAKIMRKVISIRKKDASERDEEEAILALYLHALGMLPEETVDIEEEVAPSKSGRKTAGKPSPAVAEEEDEEETEESQEEMEEEEEAA
jgi:uncharacterized protein (UPF0335 family)